METQEKKREKLTKKIMLCDDRFINDRLFSIKIQYEKLRIDIQRLMNKVDRIVKYSKERDYITEKKEEKRKNIEEKRQQKEYDDLCKVCNYPIKAKIPKNPKWKNRMNNYRNKH